ncbi:MAG TPA: carboxypeptidase regulatory-like domain-containing protein [Polyangia bacterium]|nr:carboxypeptidase regulatory-like domain-containing protein [Polyangia bacterium]
MRKSFFPIFLVCAARLASADPSGSVEGTIKYAGARKPAAAIAVPKPMSACGKSKAPPDLVLDADRALANAVVSVGGVANAPKPPPAAAKIDQKSCVYLPHVQAVPAGSKLTLINNDPLLHNVHARRGDLTLVNLAMPVQGQKLDAPSSVLAKPGVASFRCDAGHTWMSAYIHVFDHPYFAVTDEKGRFKIDGLPPGTYTLKIEHELLGSSTKSITITAGTATTADVELE